MDKQDEYEFNLLRTRYNGAMSKLAKRDERISELEQSNSEGKTALDNLTAEIGRLKRKQKRNH